MKVEIDQDRRSMAHARASVAKHRMDEAQAAFEEAEAEWLKECIECDRLDGIEIPTAAEVRGILRQS